MGEHIHKKGEWMFSYRAMYMDMDGMYRGSSSVSAADVFAAGYVVTPEWMTMEMHMLGAMYAPTDRITFMAMLPYTMMEMRHQIDPAAAPLIGLNGGSRFFTTESSGIGDLKLSSLFHIHESGPHHWIGGFGVRACLPGQSPSRTAFPGPAGF